MTLARPASRCLDLSPALAGAAITLVCVAAPAAWVALDVARGLAAAQAPAPAGGAGGGGTLLAASLGTAALIAALATALAWPAAWALRARSRFWTPLVAAPLLLPPYLAYAGWGLLRSPGTALGDWLARGPAQGPNWWLPLAGKALAVTGLALWAWPGAALVLGAGVRSLDAGTLDAARLEPMSRWRALRLRAAMLRRWIAAAFALVALVMLGSAVPLHVAQLETAAIRAWRLLDQAPPAEHWRVWVGAAPLVAGVVAGAWLAARWAWRDADLGAVREPAPSPRRPVAAEWWAGAALAASTAAPLALFVWFLREGRSILTFLRVESDAIGSSAGVGAAAGAGGAALGLAAFWAGLGGPRRAWLGSAMLLALAAAAVVPGVLVGHATLRAWLAWAPNGAETPAPLVAAAVARFGVVGAWIGWAAARAEPAERRELRRLEGGGFRAWVEGALAAHWRALAAGAVAVGVLTLHEIEASVVAAPPGARLLARDMLGFLHFFRQEELCAGAILLLGLGLAGGVAAAVLGKKGCEY